MPTREEVVEALHQVEDPELGMDIVDLGLLYDVEVEGPKVKVSYTLTSMGCPAGAMIQEDIDRVVSELHGVEDVQLGAHLRPAVEPGSHVRRREVHPRFLALPRTAASSMWRRPSREIAGFCVLPSVIDGIRSGSRVADGDAPRVDLRRCSRSSQLWPLPAAAAASGGPVAREEGAGVDSRERSDDQRRADAPACTQREPRHLHEARGRDRRRGTPTRRSGASRRRFVRPSPAPIAIAPGRCAQVVDVSQEPAGLGGDVHRREASERRVRPGCHGERPAHDGRRRCPGRPLHPRLLHRLSPLSRGSAGRSCRAARRARDARGRRRPRRAGRPRPRPAGRGPPRPARGAVEVLRRAHRRAEDRQLRHQIRFSAAGGFGPEVAPQTTIRAPRRAARRASASTSPRRRARRRRRRPAAGQLAHPLRRRRSAPWLMRRVGAELARPRELLVARGGDDRARAERLRDRERGRRDAAADPPDQHPFAGLEARAGDEHPVGRLEDERERSRFLEAESCRESGGRALAGTAISSAWVPSRCSPIDVDSAGVREAGIDHDAARRVPAITPGAVGSEDPRLRRPTGGPRGIHTSRWFSDGGAKLDQHLVRAAAPDPAPPRSGAPPARRPRGYGSPSRPIVASRLPPGPL